MDSNQSNSWHPAIEEILRELVGRPSVNPMNSSHKGSRPVESAALDYVDKVFRPFGDVTRVRQPVSELHENLIVTIPGSESGPGVLLEAHADTVPAADWADRAFTPSVENGVLMGRGAVDCKGPLTAMVWAIVTILDEGRVPAKPVTLLVAGDEEYGQTGVKRFLESNYARYLGAVVAEPTDLQPVSHHRGTIRWDLTVKGVSAHTSRPSEGIDAIAGGVAVHRALQEFNTELQKAHRGIGDPSWLTVTMFTGGRTRNALADECRLAIDCRVACEEDPDAVRGDLIGSLAGLDINIEHSEVQLCTPPLSVDRTDPFVQVVLAACRNHSVDAELTAMPYGTDAAWISPLAPTIVFGPGSIDTAHSVNERISLGAVDSAAAILRTLLLEV